MGEQWNEVMSVLDDANRLETPDGGWASETLAQIALIIEQKRFRERRREDSAQRTPPPAVVLDLAAARERKADR